MGYSLALLGAGYLVGLSVGMAMLLGLLISWGVAVPWLTSWHAFPAGDFERFVDVIWRREVRFIGAGAIAVASVWTLLKLVRPVVGGIVSTMRASRGAAAGTGDLTDTDLSPGMIGAIALACLVVIGWLLYQFLATTALSDSVAGLMLAALPFVFVIGFLIAAVTGYMAGLIGASNSPVSGVGILAILISSVVFLAIAHPVGAAAQNGLVAFALFATAIVFSIATISNNNLQDLKTGQLVGATPRAQQWALIVGVIAGALVIPWVLNLLAQAFGFAGAPNLNTITQEPLAAPQATLISALAQGVIGGDLNWSMLLVGIALGVGLIVLDEVLGFFKLLRLPPLAVGIGIYLPMSATLPVVLGAVIGHRYDAWAKTTRDPEYSKRLAVLVASGLIVGESLFGVVLAGLIRAFSSDAPLALVAADFAPAPFLGPLVFAALIVVLYGWMMRRASAAR
jgi:putative OPT family oligopeptide transporter